MNEPRILPDDPRLTAYALGELSGDERAAMEAALRRTPALRSKVDEIRATAAQIEAAFAGETIAPPASTPVAKAGIVLKLNGHTAKSARTRAGSRSPLHVSRPRAPIAARDAYRVPQPGAGLLRFPQFYYVVATAAAACFAVVVALRNPAPPPVKRVERTVRHEIVFVPANSIPTPAESPPSPATASPPAETMEAQPAELAVPPLPSAPADSAAEPATATPVPAASTKPAFIEGSLSLINRVPNEAAIASQPTVTNSNSSPATTSLPQRAAVGPSAPPGASETSVAVVAAPFDRSIANPPPLDNPRPAHNPSDSPERFTAEALGTRGVESATRPLFFETLAPSVTAPVVAGATLPSVVPGTVTATQPSTGSVTTTGSGDIVVLSTITVTADRAVGFATGSNAAGVASDKRGPSGRDDRPHAPPGARFGRNTEAYSYIRDNNFLGVVRHPLSTFAADVDTASYANVRRIIEHGSPPPRDAVRIEEMLNYFPYHYAPPQGDAPFAASLEVADAPWAPTHRLVRIGLKAREVAMPRRPAANLVFLLDVSGSMNQLNKLPLVKQSLRLLLGKLRPDDRIAIVTYAGEAGLALASTPVAQAREIMNALEALTPAGPANGAMGIQLAYDLAKSNFVRDGINRVILCTDGDFNVGPTSEGELVRLVEEKAASGVSLTVLGFGMGNYKDATLEKLAARGKGNYGYIDTRREAEKLLVEQVNSTLVTVAKDVKLQVEFNPATVSRYRLIGYENRLLRKEDFNRDTADAGDIGAGHTVTALYEIVPVGAENKSEDEVPPLEELRYAARGAVSSRLEMPGGKRDPLGNELLTVKVRYKKSDSLFSIPKTLEFPLINATTAFAQASADFRFAAAVAQFGMILRGSPHRGNATMKDVASWAAAAVTSAVDDPGGYRSEFLGLVRKAGTMME